MKLRNLAFALLALLLSYASSSQQVKKMTIADLEAYILKSKKPLVVNFWATFCKPCIEEIPYFLRAIKEKHKGEIELILVSLDLPDYFPSRISSFANRKNYSVPIVWLNETDADYFCPRIDINWSGAIPATLMVNNKKSYKRFYEQQLTPAKLYKELED